MRKRDEPVRLTRIYTRGGDKGETSLGDGSRVSKLDLRVAAMGDVDEVNSLVGWAGGLNHIQNELFDLGADLSVPYTEADDRLRVTQSAVERLEREIDEANASLPELRSFVLPGGSDAFASSISRSSRSTALCVTRSRSSASVYGTERSAPRSNSSFWMRSRPPAQPTSELTSSTSPIAATRRSSFETRDPSPRLVSPLSPPRV